MRGTAPRPYADRVDTAALVADLAKKSGLVWVSYAGADHAVWHEWVGDAVCVVAGGSEQPLPDIAAQQTVTLRLRSKGTRALVVVVEADVEVVAPGSEHWDATTTALKSGRLNLVDGDHAIERWAHEAVVVRIVPAADARLPVSIADDLPHTSPRLTR